MNARSLDDFVEANSFNAIEDMRYSDCSEKRTGGREGCHDGL
jgi:hypothetical protein